MSEEEEPQWHGPIIGYCNKGLLYRRPAPYNHHAVSSAGELGRTPPEPPEVARKQTIKAMFQTGKLTSLGKRIVEACPPPDAPGIDEHSLIEKLNGLDAYTDFQRDIAGLAEVSYLVLKDGLYTRAN